MVFGLVEQRYILLLFHYSNVEKKKIINLIFLFDICRRRYLCKQPRSDDDDDDTPCPLKKPTRTTIEYHLYMYKKNN